MMKPLFHKTSIIRAIWLVWLRLLLHHRPESSLRLTSIASRWWIMRKNLSQAIKTASSSWWACLRRAPRFGYIYFFRDKVFLLHLAECQNVSSSICFLIDERDVSKAVCQGCHKNFINIEEIHDGGKRDGVLMTWARLLKAPKTDAVLDSCRKTI